MIRIGSITLALAMALSLGVAGCGNVESGAGDGTKPGGPGPGGADDDDDDDGASPTPGPGGEWDPGQLPTALGGMAAFSHTHNRTVGDVAGAYEDFSGMLNFFPVPVGPLPPTMQEVWDDFPQHPLDTCQRVYPSSLALSTNIDPPNAGDVTLEGPNGAISLTPMLGLGMYISFWNDPATYVPMSDYTLRATGGQIGAFEIPMKSPGQVTALTPDITSSAPFVVPRDQPFLLKWESVQDGRPLYLTFTQQDFPEMDPYMWMCKLTDDGEFTVPVSVLQNFGATVPPFATEEWRDKMELRRWHYSSFEVPGGVAPILAAFESGWYADIELQ